MCKKESDPARRRDSKVCRSFRVSVAAIERTLSSVNIVMNSVSGGYDDFIGETAKLMFSSRLRNLDDAKCSVALFVSAYIRLHLLLALRGWSVVAPQSPLAA